MFFSAGDIVVIVFKSFEILIILRILFSMLPFIGGGDFKVFVHDFTEPILRPFRLTIGMGGGMGLDLSPIIAMFIMYQVEKLILQLLYS